jgi:hypothetical protein
MRAHGVPATVDGLPLHPRDMASDITRAPRHVRAEATRDRDPTRGRRA